MTIIQSELNISHEYSQGNNKPSYYVSVNKDTK